MTAESERLFEKNLWREIFCYGKLSHCMAEIQDSDGVVVQLPDSGDVLVTVKRAAPVGANFMSDVYFVTASVNDCLYKSFAKVLCLNPASQTAAFIGKWYHREIGVFRDWIPILESIRSSSGLDEHSLPINTAKCYYVNLVEKTEEEGYDNDTAVVIEDLKSKGFTMVNPTFCHDLQHAQIAMKSFANYHALSIAGLRKWREPDGSHTLPSTLDVYSRTPYYVHPPIVYGSMVLPNYSRVLRHFQHEEAALWLDGLIPKLEKIWSWDDFIRAGPLTCIIHGDSWNNNMLFRYSKTEEGEIPVEMAMIDWQIARCGHPSIDLCYYLFCGTSAEFRARHLNDLFALYFATLKANLLKLGIDLEAEGYTEEQFFRETRQRFVLGMFMAFFLLPIILDSAKASKHAEDIKEKISDEDGKKLAGDQEAFEDKQKNSWEALFQPDTITSNAVLSERLVQLILDVKKVAMEFDCKESSLPPVGKLWASLFRSEETIRQIAKSKAIGRIDCCNADEALSNVTIQVERAAAKGTNFMSEAYFLTSEVCGFRYTAFIKIPPFNGAARTAAFVGRCYQREAVLYEHWLPRLERIRRAAIDKAKRTIQLRVPNYFYGNVVDNENNNGYESGTLIVMEDLRNRGFRMNPKIVTRLNDPHARHVTLALADYHALSIAGYRQNSSSPDPLPLEMMDLFRKNPYFIDVADIFQRIIIPNYSRLLRHFQFDDTAAWLDGLTPKLESIWSWEDFIRENPLTCVLHGDCWSNNMLFRYSRTEEGEMPTEVVMVDFQIARFGYPSIDLCYYLFCSTSTEFRSNHFNGLLSLYFKTLKTNLLELGIDLDTEHYTDARFYQEAHQRFVLCMLMAFLILPVIADEDPDDLDRSLEHFRNNVESTPNENKELDGFEFLFHFDTISRRPHLAKKIVQLAVDIQTLSDA